MRLRIWILAWGVATFALSAVDPRHLGASGGDVSPLPVTLTTEDGGQRHGVLWYATAHHDSVRRLTMQRYKLGITGKGDNADWERVAMKALNPDFKWFVYNSGTDNYVTSSSGTPEHDLLVSLAQDRGWDVEEAYQHYWDDTRLVLEGDTLTIPGWGGGSATDPAQSRIPVYYKNLSRRVVCFASSRAAQLHREVLLRLAFELPFAGSDCYPDGLFLDNSAYQIFNYGTILSGGHVRETPGRERMGTLQYQDWHWNVNYGPFLTALKDTLEASAGWTADGERKELMINISNVWDDGYVSRDVTDILFQEFQYNAVRDFGTWMVDEAYRRDQLAAAAGIASFYSATMTRQVNGSPTSYSLAETMLTNLVWYLMTRTPSTLFYEMGVTTPSQANWDTLTWRGCIDVANERLGLVEGGPYTLAAGTDPLGNAYVVKARRYQRGLVVMRNRGNWDEGIEATTAISVPLPKALIPVLPSGAIGDPVQDVKLRNGQGFLFLDETVPVELASFAVEWLEQEGALLRWSLHSAGDEQFRFHVYRGETKPVTRLTREPFSGSRTYEFVDTSVSEGGARYWLAEETHAGHETWHGPVELTSRHAAAVFLSRGQPNPFRAWTTIRFELSTGGRARLQVYDVRGRLVRQLYDGVGDGRSHSVKWAGEDASGRSVPAGVYFYRLETPQGVFTSKLQRIAETEP